MRAGTKAHIVLLLACVGSRLLTAIYYIEDPDSLRFALSLVDYDVGRLQPHFPAYPVFCWVVKAVYTFTGRYAVAFALVGGVATYLVIAGCLAIAGARLERGRGLILAGLLFLNPLLWLLGNRYMPDLTGLAVLLAAFFWLTSGNRPVRGSFLLGLLAGTRLSCLPFLAVPALLAFRANRAAWRQMAVGCILGVAVWLIPLIWMTGWDVLVSAARVQTIGHFGEFGGTFRSEPGVTDRVAGLFEGVWAHGLGLYWTGRHGSTGVAAVALILLILPCRSRSSRPRKTDWVMVATWSAYLAWIFLGQNVVYKSRHVLPLLPFLLIALATIADAAVRKSAWRRVAFVSFLAAYAFVTANLVVQHTRPTAIAQIKTYLQEKRGDLHIAAAPLVEYYLSAQGVNATYVSVERETDLRQLDTVPPGASIVSIGNAYRSPARPLKSRLGFYHNPYVNRMWPEIHVYEY